jgi:hypothetical protein
VEQEQIEQVAAAVRVIAAATELEQERSCIEQMIIDPLISHCIDEEEAGTIKHYLEHGTHYEY